MLDLSFPGNLPSTVDVGGLFFPIKTDFRTWLKFAEEIKTGFVNIKNYYLQLPKDLTDAVKGLIDFYNPPRELPRKVDGKKSDIVLDYKTDGALLYSAFMEQYHINLLDPKLDLHWHEFLALVEGLHDTMLNKIMEYRNYDETDKTKYEEQMKRNKEMWKLPQPEDKEIKKALDEFNALFE